MELCGFDGSVECKMCHDSCESDVSGGETLVISSRARFGDRSDGVVSASEPNITGDEDRPLSTDSDRSGDTESHRADFGAGFSDPFTQVTYVLEPADTEDGDRLLSTDSDNSKNTESHSTDFSTSFGDPFTYVAYAPAPTDTEVRNQSPSVRLWWRDRISFVIPVGRPTPTEMHPLPPKCTSPDSVTSLPAIRTHQYMLTPMI